ncbi:MAG TPA: hypothetical protein VMS02_00105 [Solirubrobacteraceae bacterium]|nr:hypothetical protein [Solirubrobacteraceae bacterium]
MSSPIAPTPSAAANTAVQAPSAAERSAASTGARAAGTGRPIALDALPSSPPQEVLDQMAGAAQIYDRLSAQGRELRFARDAASGRTQIEVRDRAGHLLGQLSPAEALELAAGAPLQ